ILGLWEGRSLAGLLVLSEDVDATLVALRLAPLLCDEGVDDGQRLLLGVHATTQADQLGIVVLAGELRGLHGPGQCAACARHLVRGDLLAVAGTTQDDAQGALVSDDPAGCL